MRRRRADAAAFRDLDVLHLGYYIGVRHSIRKIIDNVIQGCSGLRQNWLSFRERRFLGGFDEARVIRFVNAVRPKILHLHFSSVFDRRLFRRLRYRPAIVATVHGEVTSAYRDDVDVLICIHEPGLERNQGERVLIENTPWVDARDVRRELRPNGEACLASRFSTQCIGEQTIEAYGRIGGTVYLYGDSAVTSGAAEIRRWCARYPNIVVRPWSNHVEREIVKHSVFAFFPAEPNPQRCDPLNVMEAVALGIPTVAVPRRSRQRYVVDGYNGFVVESQDELVARCNELLGDAELYSRIKQNALAHASELRNTMPLEYEAVYRRFL